MQEETDLNVWDRLAQQGWKLHQMVVLDPNDIAWSIDAQNFACKEPVCNCVRLPKFAIKFALALDIHRRVGNVMKKRPQHAIAKAIVVQVCDLAGQKDWNAI